MKMFKKMAVLAAALMMVSVFVSCDNNAEETDAAVVAEFNGYFYPEDVIVRENVSREAELKIEPVEQSVAAKVVFYDDDTFKLSYD